MIRAINHHFSRPELLELALTHSSFNRRTKDRTQTNQRLEFLGDRVLGLFIAELLYETFPNEEEGPLSRRHTALVRSEALSRIANEIGLAEHIIMSKSEEEMGGRENPGLLADTLEAVIAALFLDGGAETAKTFIRDNWKPLMEEDVKPPTDAKTELQEWAQARGLELPSYRETTRQGPSHAPTFTIEVSLNGMQPAIAEGPSKRSAEQSAAKVILNMIKAENSGK